MSEKSIVLVTGANQGIGYYAAQQLAAKQYQVIIGCRNVKKGEKAIESIISDSSHKVDRANLDTVRIDLADDASIEAAAEAVGKKYGRLDILVNNAGIAGNDNTSASRREQFQNIYNTNVFGTAICTDAFIPLLRKSMTVGGKRIVFTSSGLGSLAFAADPGYQWPANIAPLYRSSKSAENMLCLHYALLLRDEEFTVCAMCPGHCGTNLNGYGGPRHPSEGARVIVTTIEANAEDVHAQFIGDDGVKRYPW